MRYLSDLLITLAHEIHIKYGAGFFIYQLYAHNSADHPVKVELVDPKQRKTVAYWNQYLGHCPHMALQLFSRHHAIVIAVDVNATITVEVQDSVTRWSQGKTARWSFEEPDFQLSDILDHMAQFQFEPK